MELNSNINLEADIIDILKKYPSTEKLDNDSNDNEMLLVLTDNIYDIANYLKSVGYDYFNCLTAAEDDDHYISIYSIYALLDGSKRKITLKVNSPKDNPIVPSISEIYPSANWFERESYDLMGIVYKGHPNLTRILTSDDWVGHTLRKDYKMVEPESYVDILKKEIDAYVQEGIDRSDVYRHIT